MHSHVLCNTVCNALRDISTIFHNVREGVDRTRDIISAQRDTLPASAAIRRPNGEIVEKCGNPGAAGADAGRTSAVAYFLHARNDCRAVAVCGRRFFGFRWCQESGADILRPCSFLSNLACTMTTPNPSSSRREFLANAGLMAVGASAQTLLPGGAAAAPDLIRNE